MASTCNGLSCVEKWLRMALRWLTKEVVAPQQFIESWRERDTHREALCALKKIRAFTKGFCSVEQSFVAMEVWHDRA